MTNSNNKFTKNPQSVEDFLNFAGNSFKLPLLLGEGGGEVENSRDSVLFHETRVAK